MKRSFFILVSMGILSNAGLARPVTSGRAPVLRHMTDVAVQRPQTTTQTQHPVTQTRVTRPTTQGQVSRPVTSVAVSHPQTTVQVLHPTTQVAVNQPATTVEVVHPQTTMQVNRPQTPTLEEIQAAGQATSAKVGGKKTASSQASTSMSNFTPKQARDLTATTKAASAGGGSMNLGNTNADQAAKDVAAKASLLGSQNNQNMDVNPNQNKLGGIDKLVTDRSKWKEKQKK